MFEKMKFVDMNWLGSCCQEKYCYYLMFKPLLQTDISAWISYSSIRMPVHNKYTNLKL